MDERDEVTFLTWWKAYAPTVHCVNPRLAFLIVIVRTVSRHLSLDHLDPLYELHFCTGYTAPGFPLLTRRAARARMSAAAQARHAPVAVPASRYEAVGWRGTVQ